MNQLNRLFVLHFPIVPLHLEEDEEARGPQDANANQQTDALSHMENTSRNIYQPLNAKTPSPNT